MTTGAPSQIVGRDAELDAVRAVLDGVPAGLAALFIEGEPGIGKTTIWQAAIEAGRSRGWTVLEARAAESEARLSFVGLMDLLGGIAEPETDLLPPPQRDALNGVMLRETTGSSHASGAVLVAVTAVLRGIAARSSRLVVAIDDLPWLDTASRKALEFALRRLGPLPVLLLASRRSGAGSTLGIESALGLERVDRLQVGPLSLGALYQLIRSRTGRSLPRPSLVRVHEVAAGNPLYALELAEALTDGGDATGPLGVMPIPPRLNVLLSKRLRRLPARTRRVLLAAAATSGPTIETLCLALAPSSAADVAADLAVAERAGVVVLDRGGVRFTHPLLASLLYNDAAAPERRRIHEGLVGVSVSPEERARHLALAALGPDEAVARALDAAAEDAARRGATDAALELAERAVTMTPPSEGSAFARRTVRSGSLAATVGDHTRARERLGTSVALLAPGSERAEVLLELAELANPLTQGLLLLDRAAEDAASDALISTRIHRARAAMAYALGRVADAEREAAVAVEVARGTNDAAALGPALGDLAHWTFCAGGGIRRDLFGQAVALDPSPSATSPRRHLAKVLMDDGNLAEARPMLEDLLAAAMRLGDLRSAATYLLHLGELEVWAGRWLVAIERADESLLIRQHTNQPAAPLYVKAMALACLGRIEESRELAATGLAEAERGSDLVGVLQNLHALGFAELSAGDDSAAQPLLARATDLHRPRWTNEYGDGHYVPDDIEASLAVGEFGRARELLHWMDTVGAATGRAWTLAMASRCRALLLAAEGDLDAAQASADKALVHHERMEMPFEHSRTLLVAGTILRRRKKRGLAADVLARARAGFEALGAEPWRLSASAEIDRLGTRTQAQHGLTPVEDEIARLVAEGLTNRQIADRVFLSPRTIEANVSRIFRKLDLRSRTELAAAMGRSTTAGARASETTGDSPDYARSPGA